MNCCQARWAKEERVDICWYFMRKRILPSSYGQNYYSYLNLLAPDEEMPRACEIACGMLVAYKIGLEFLYERIYVATRDIDLFTSDPYYENLKISENKGGKAQIEFNSCKWVTRASNIVISVLCR